MTSTPPPLLEGLTHVESERLDHLGIIAALCREIQLADTIDEIVGSTDRKVSVGQATVAMVINALGIVNRPLYLTPEFYAQRPLSRLIAPGITADDLNDDSLGRALDALFATGLTEIFERTASRALSLMNVDPGPRRHLDTTTFSFHGSFPNQSDEEGAVQITHGYSKDHRPDLKQITVALITATQSALPVWIKMLSGNASDAKEFTPCVQAYREQLEDERDVLYVADSSLYSEENIETLGPTPWLTRVPARLKEVKRLYKETDRKDFEEVEGCEGYATIEFDHHAKTGLQHWVLIFSQAAFERDEAKLKRKIEDEQSAIKKAALKLKNKAFESVEAADQAIEQLAQRWRYHDANYEVEEKARYSKSGRPTADAVPDRIDYHVNVTEVIQDEESIEAALRMCGKFMLATNKLEPEPMAASELLIHYKAQSGTVEGGFRFLKDPMFFAAGMYLQKPERVMAMTMIMGLSLLVYALGELKLRKVLAESDETIPDQTGKPTAKPTLRRVFQVFEKIEVLVMHMGGQEHRHVLNVKPLHQKILGLLGAAYEEMYAVNERAP